MTIALLDIAISSDYNSNSHMTVFSIPDQEQTERRPSWAAEAPRSRPHSGSPAPLERVGLEQAWIGSLPEDFPATIRQRFAVTRIQWQCLTAIVLDKDNLFRQTLRREYDGNPQVMSAMTTSYLNVVRKDERSAPAIDNLILDIIRISCVD